MRSVAVLGLAFAGCGDNAAEFEPLINGTDLTGWYTWIPSTGVDYDPLGMFRVTDGQLHILGQDVPPARFEFGYLASRREYEDFHLRFEYRFGDRHYVSFPKDSGFFFAAVGEDRIWPRSIECQVMIGDTGSVYVFENARLDTTIDPAIPSPTYREGGVPHTTPRMPAPFPRVTHSAAHDRADGWNHVEVIVRAATSELIVNGNVTFRSTNHTQPDPDAPDDPARDLPLRRGRLVIQQEGAEIYYRNVELMEL